MRRTVPGLRMAPRKSTFKSRKGNTTECKSQVHSTRTLEEPHRGHRKGQNLQSEHRPKATKKKDCKNMLERATCSKNISQAQGVQKHTPKPQWPTGNPEPKNMGKTKHVEVEERRKREQTPSITKNKPLTNVHSKQGQLMRLPTNSTVPRKPSSH